MSAQNGRSQSGLAPNESKAFAYEQVIDDICDLNWSNLSQEDVVNVAWAHYHFSVQFRESPELACALYPDDDRLRQLDQGERNTDNLSPWPGVAAIGERMNHDEFMRRTLALTTISESQRRNLATIGQVYLTKTRTMDEHLGRLQLASRHERARLGDRVQLRRSARR